MENDLLNPSRFNTAICRAVDQFSVKSVAPVRLHNVFDIVNVNSAFGLNFHKAVATLALSSSVQTVQEIKMAAFMSRLENYFGNQRAYMGHRMTSKLESIPNDMPLWTRMANTFGVLLGRHSFLFDPELAEWACKWMLDTYHLVILDENVGFDLTNGSFREMGCRYIALPEHVLAQEQLFSRTVLEDVRDAYSSPLVTSNPIPDISGMVDPVWNIVTEYLGSRPRKAN